MVDNQTPEELIPEVPGNEDNKMRNELWSSRRKMAWVSLWGIIIPTCAILLGIRDPDVLDKVADLMSWYYLALASVIGAYVGFKSWATIKGRGKE